MTSASFFSEEQVADLRVGLEEVRPIMAHSIYVLGHTILFHPQLLADFATVEDQ